MLKRALATAEEQQKNLLKRAVDRVLFDDPELPLIVQDDRGQLMRINETARRRLALDNNRTPEFMRLLENEFGSLGSGKEHSLTYNSENWNVSRRTVQVKGCEIAQVYRFKPAALSASVPGPKRAGKTISPHSFIHKSECMDEIDRLTKTYAKTQGTVLIHGETGTGKELVARQLHRHSRHANGAFVPINCGAIPEELFESELFGYVDGAFTSSRRGGRAGLLEEANNGVFFLDEVSEMPLSQQAKLLRVIQEKSFRPLGTNKEIYVNVKFVAATNRDLAECVKRGTFREDLYYRINVFTILLPNLASREGDVLEIARYFARELLSFYGDRCDLDDFMGLIEHLLLQYRWPGNVRELENIMERLVVCYPMFDTTQAFSRGLATIIPEWFSASPLDDLREVDSHGSIKEQELRLIQEALVKFNGDKGQAAKSLGISPTTLWRRLKPLKTASE